MKIASLQAIRPLPCHPGLIVGDPLTRFNMSSGARLTRIHPAGSTNAPSMPAGGG